MDIREVSSEECSLARTYSGQEVGIVIGTSGPYIVQTILKSRKRAYGHGMMFVPLAAYFAPPKDAGWTKLVVIDGEYKGRIGYVRVIEYDASVDLMRGNLGVH